MPHPLPQAADALSLEGLDLVKRAPMACGDQDAMEQDHTDHLVGYLFHQRIQAFTVMPYPPAPG
jgi:hypothetical protein